MDMNRKLVLGVVVAIGVGSCGVCGGVSLAQAVPGKPEKQAMTQSKFFCNVKALNANERARHKELTDKLVSQRTRMVETGKGFEFQYSPGAISIAELAEWAASESKCCPFFDFHIDLENEGTLLCLRLTGEEGVKAFIKAEFGVPGKI